MTLGIALGPIWIFDANNAGDAAVDARSERALRVSLVMELWGPRKFGEYALGSQAFWSWQFWGEEMLYFVENVNNVNSRSSNWDVMRFR